jgi:peptide/nickel transport system permease protein
MSAAFDDEATGPAAPAEETPFARVVADYRASPKAVIALVLLLAIALLALGAPLWTPQNPYDLLQLDILDSRLPPGSAGLSGATYWLGTDAQGRDMLSAIFYGLRTSLIVGVASCGLAMLIGTLVGLTAAFAGGRIDTMIMRVVDIQLSFPSILVALILLALLGRGADKIVLALVIVQWAYFARTVRGSALSERRREYMEAAFGLGLSRRRLVLRHLLPNCLPPVIVVGAMQVAHAIALEATLSFLGIGLPVTEPSLGLLIANGYEFMMGGLYWISVLPGVALATTIVAINLVSDQLRDVLNPRLQR